MEEKNNTPIRNQPIARAGEKRTPAPEAAPSADIFGAMYKEQKAQTEKAEIEKQAVADAQLEAEEATVTQQQNEKKDEKSEKFKPVFILLIILTAVLFAVSLIYLVFGLIKNVPEKEENEAPVNISSASLSSPFEYQRIYGTDFPQGIQDKYKLLYAQNNDFVGWLTVPNTSIDMPVYKTSNNSYYLKHDNYDTYTKYGTLFMDMYSDPLNLTRNTTIYGHNFDNKLIFDELHNYQDPEFFKKSPVIEFNTLYKDYKWKVIAAFHTNGSSSGDNNYLFYYIAAKFGNNSFMKFYDELQQRSYIHTGVDVQPTDKILTLSTCTYFFDRNGALENARFVVVARLVRDGESEAVDTSLVTANENVRYPQLYYDVFGGTNPWRNSTKWVPEVN